MSSTRRTTSDVVVAMNAAGAENLLYRSVELSVKLDRYNFTAYKCTSSDAASSPVLLTRAAS